MNTWRVYENGKTMAIMWDHRSTATSQTGDWQVSKCYFFNKGCSIKIQQGEGPRGGPPTPIFFWGGGHGHIWSKNPEVKHVKFSDLSSSLESWGQIQETINNRLKYTIAYHHCRGSYKQWIGDMCKWSSQLSLELHLLKTLIYSRYIVQHRRRKIGKIEGGGGATCCAWWLVRANVWKVHYVIFLWESGGKAPGTCQFLNKILA